MLLSVAMNRAEPDLGFCSGSRHHDDFPGVLVAMQCSEKIKLTRVPGFWVLGLGPGQQVL